MFGKVLQSYTNYWILKDKTYIKKLYEGQILYCVFDGAIRLPENISAMTGDWCIVILERYIT